MLNFLRRFFGAARSDANLGSTPVHRRPNPSPANRIVEAKDDDDDRQSTRAPRATYGFSTATSPSRRSTSSSGSLDRAGSVAVSDAEAGRPAPKKVSSTQPVFLMRDGGRQGIGMQIGGRRLENISNGPSVGRIHAGPYAVVEYQTGATSEDLVSLTLVMTGPDGWRSVTLEASPAIRARKFVAVAARPTGVRASAPLRVPASSGALRHLMLAWNPASPDFMTTLLFLNQASPSSVSRASATYSPNR